MSGVQAVDALACEVARAPVDADQDAGGTPTVGSVEVFAAAGVEVGIWELGVGAMYDVEVDEVFVVLAGEAVVEELDDAGRSTSRTTLRAGIVCRLSAGTRTRWTVSSPLRKVYIVGGTAA